MKILQDKDHFIHQRVKLELFPSDDFFKVLEEFWKPIRTIAESAPDRSQLNWDKINDHSFFFYDFEGGEQTISNWLKQSRLAQKEFLLTCIHSNAEVIKVRVSDFIPHWNSFNLAANNKGLVFISDDGELIMEFTDNCKYNLHSNFKIENRTQSTQTDIFK